jgi:hypothetical protein
MHGFHFESMGWQADSDVKSTDAAGGEFFKFKKYYIYIFGFGTESSPCSSSSSGSSMSFSARKNSENSIPSPPVGTADTSCHRYTIRAAVWASTCKHIQAQGVSFAPVSQTLIRCAISARFTTERLTPMSSNARSNSLQNDRMV